MNLDAAAWRALPARWLLFTGLLVAVGGACWRLVVFPRAVAREPIWSALAPAITRRAASAVVVGIALGLIGCAWLAVVERDALDVPLATILTATRWGRAWAAQVALLLLCGIAGIVARTNPGRTAAWRLCALAAALAAAAPAWLGHAGSDERAPLLAPLVDALHVLGAGAWLGTLALGTAAMWPALQAHEGRAERNTLLGAALRAFNPIALGGAGIVVGTGIVSSWLRVRAALAPPLAGARWRVPGATPYVQLLVLKILLVSLVAVFGAVNWRRHTPAVTTAPNNEAVPFPVRALARSVAKELLIGALVLIVTALLVATEPPGSP